MLDKNLKQNRFKKKLLKIKNCKIMMLLINELLLNVEIFGTELFNKDFYELLIKLLFNLAIVSYIVRYLYFNSTKNKDYLFTYLMISIAQYFYYVFFLKM